MTNSPLNLGAKQFAQACRSAMLFLAALLTATAAAAQTTTGDAVAGATLYNANCDGCHGATVGSIRPAIKNAANAGGLINEVMTAGMGSYTAASFTSTQENNIAAYIAQQISESSPSGVAVAHNSGGLLISMINIQANTIYGPITKGIFSSGGTRGSATFSTSGSTINATYVPDTGQCGTDTVTYYGATSGNTRKTNFRTFSVDIADPAAPIINSAISKTSTVGLATTYTITTTGGTPLSWGATSIPTNLLRTNNVISGTPTAAGTFNTTVSAFNCLNGNLAGRSDVQAVTWTVNKGTQAALTARINGLSGNQIFTFSNPNGTATLSTIGGTGAGAVTYASSNTAVCTVTATTTLNLVGAGTCTITATKATDANYLVTSDTIGVTVNQAAQVLSFGAQTTPRTFVQSGTFLVSPIATNTSTSQSGIAITYDSNTPTVCTLPGTTSTTVTMVAAGICTIGANLAGNTNYLAAPEVPQNVTINPILPQPPTIGAGVGGNAQAVINFTPPANTGGTAILDYTATCTASGQTTRTATVASSPATVLSMVNGFVYACSVKSRNSVGISATASAPVNVTPTSSPVITSLNNTTFTITSNGAFNIIATGAPTPTITMTGTLPAGVTFNGGVGTATLTGIPAAGTAGTTTQNYPLSFTANNGTPPAAVQSFTLTVQKASQTTNFGALATRPMRPVPALLAATASSGLPVSFSIDPSTTANCFLLGNLLYTSNVGACGVRASQAGNTSYNAAQTILQGFNITQGTQTIDFGVQGAQTYSPAGSFGLDPKALSLDPIDLTTDTGLAIAYASLTPGVCGISGATVTIITAGTCTIEATQAGDANYAAALPVTQDIAINMASQTISWGAQSSQTFGTGGTFMISPLASGGGSGNAIAYGHSTPGVCTVSGTTVTKVSSGICTLTANQAGDGNYAAASQVSRTLTISASVPSAPMATLITPSDSQVVIEFDPPPSDGGTVITNYRATCNPGGVFADGSTSPIIVTGLNNNTLYTCSVRAQNAAGNSPASNDLMATPFLETGLNLWANVCSGCHGMLPAGVRFNAAGQSGAVINYVRSAQPIMQVNTAVQALTPGELAEIAKYIETFVPAISLNTAFNTAVGVDVSSHLTLGTVSFTAAVSVSPPANGMLSAFSGTQITYTPNPGFVGVDTFTYRGTGSAPMVNGDPRTVTITVAAPPPPVITSPAIASGMFNSAFTYQIAATNSPTSYSATPLGLNFTIDTMTGLISGTPMTTGIFMVTAAATNAGGTGMQTVTVTISPANQSITFGAQASATYSYLGSFVPFPAATASSGLAVSYSSLTPSVCTYIGPHYIMHTAGTCTLAANQPGNPNYNAALQVTQNVEISPTVPDPPTIGIGTAGSGNASIGFTSPLNNGGTPITSYTASCAPGPITGNGGASPVTVNGLTNGVTYTCQVRATNAVGNSGFSTGSVMVMPTATPVPPLFTSAVATTFTVLSAGNFNVTATGTPPPTITQSGGVLPAGVTFAAGALSGAPATGTATGSPYPLTFTATNGSGSVMQSFTLTVQKANQSISFTGPPSQPFTPSAIPLVATATSGLAVSFTPNTPTVCTVSGATLTLLTVGTCSITANQPGDENYNAATGVTQGFTVSQATQTISFPVQTTTSRGFLASSIFAISPTASASSGLAVSYSSNTLPICTVLGTNVTMVAPGTCTIAANQSGSANYLAAPQVTRSVLLTTTVPGAPVIGIATGGNAQATINFAAPANNGGSAILDYTATCNPGAVSVVGGVSPVVVSGLANNVLHTCSVRARNAVGLGGASDNVTVTPLSGQGSVLWTQVCDVCHTSVPSGTQLNGAGTSATVINFVRSNQTLMAFNSAVQSLTLADLADIATYIAASIPPNDVTATRDMPVMIDVNNHITLTNQMWSAFTAIEVVTGPINGALGAFSGTQIQYTPTNGFIGTDSFTYRGKRTGGIAYDGDPQTVNITVNPPVPGITSGINANGTFGVGFNYQITATNTPTAFDATGLPGGLSVSTQTGAISGTPTQTGTFTVGLSANNAGGTGGVTLMLQIDPAPQTITFGAQTSPRTYAVGGTFAISPLATGGASNNPIAYDSSTQAVCTVSVTMVTMVSAGICTITANQAGDANYAAAAQATQSVLINATIPNAPTIGMATAGNAVATITFTPAANNTGSPITSYNASCIPAAAGSNAASPINLSGLINNTQYTCTVTASNSAGTSAPSDSVMFTPVAVVPPGAPTDVIATAGDTTASIAFAAPANDGGGTITSYTATCLPGGIISNGLASPLLVTGLTNGLTYMCTVTAANFAGPGANSASVSVTPLPPLALVSVVSRKFHGTPTPYDVPINHNLLIGDNVDVEPRAIGSGHTLIFTFNNPITNEGNTNATDSSNVSVGAASPARVGNTVIVTLTGVPDNKRLMVSLSNVNGVVAPFTASMGFLMGDVNNFGSVNASDISGVKARFGLASGTNFRFDVNASGTVDQADVSAVKARSGLVLPP